MGYYQNYCSEQVMLAHTARSMAAPSPISIRLPQPHHGQQKIIAEAKRFNVLAGGRRFEKSCLGVDRLVKPVLEGFPCAWFSPS